jgi:anhydro-N-acetylmuramic acid kinase
VNALSTEDAAATLTAFTAASIAAALPHLPGAPEQAIVCGGGASNPAIMRALAERLPCRVMTGRDLGWQSDAIEAQAFAYLAVRSARGLPLTFPGTTGVDRPLTGGVLLRPQE